MSLLWLGLGITLGIGLGWLMRAAVITATEVENTQLRATLQAIRPFCIGLPLAVRMIDCALEQEAA